MQIPHSKPYVDPKDELAAAAAVKSGMHATGQVVEIFEGALSRYVFWPNKAHGKAVTSGTTALHLALMALDVKENDRVIIPSYVCQSVLNAVNYTGAMPVFADLPSDFTEKGYNISEKTIKPWLKQGTKAIILPHMFGCPADLEEIVNLGIPVIEDCAQSLGADYKKKKTGSFGDIGVFSFYATKVISTGQGGMLVTLNDKLNEKIRDLTKYDRRESYKVAHNYNMTNILASLGISQLTRLSGFISKRKKIGERYDHEFKDLNFKLPPKKPGSFPFRYVVHMNDKEQRENLERKLKEKQIKAEQPVFKPLHQYLNLPKEKFPNTELAHDTALSIPIYPALKDEEIEYIIENVKDLMKN